MPEYADAKVRCTFSCGVVPPWYQAAARRGGEVPVGFCSARTSVVVDEQVQHHREPLSTVKVTPEGSAPRSLVEFHAPSRYPFDPNAPSQVPWGAVVYGGGGRLVLVVVVLLVVEDVVLVVEEVVDDVVEEVVEDVVLLVVDEVVEDVVDDVVEEVVDEVVEDVVDDELLASRNTPERTALAPALRVTVIVTVPPAFTEMGNVSQAPWLKELVRLSDWLPEPSLTVALWRREVLSQSTA